ncbi:hypothetical protein AFA91_12880 [Mycolicibacterium goodii]|uniref:PASTA domain-containing protein n=2 Tax=Mycolicibacterium goodii TaxID=134601 RepID=A0A0K0XFW9_MYCGD|nr:hypothetical protein AFA91_12880 [Mycolicibacterium goodii]
MSYALGALTMGAMASAALFMGGTAAAAPTEQSVEQTVNSLKTSGYHVIVNRTGAAALSSCKVVGVRQGPVHSTDDSRGGGSIKTTVISRIVYVDVAC